jgi:hypothetical protein
MKHNIVKAVTALALCAVATSLLTGCAWSIGGKKEGETIAQPTRGQQLIDLKRAKDQGAITEQEYEKQKEELLNQ